MIVLAVPQSSLEGSLSPIVLTLATALFTLFTLEQTSMQNQEDWNGSCFRPRIWAFFFNCSLDYWPICNAYPFKNCWTLEVI